MEVRLLEFKDAEMYWEIRLEALKENPEAFLTSYDEAIQRENPVDQVANNLSMEGNFTYGAFEDEQLVGIVTLMQENREKIKHKANIFAMYVTPKKQGLGIGKALLIAAIEKARTEKEIEQIQLTVVSTNEKAKGLYTRLGFSRFGIEEKSLKVNDVYHDKEYMVLFLK